MLLLPCPPHLAIEGVVQLLGARVVAAWFRFLEGETVPVHEVTRGSRRRRGEREDEKRRRRKELRGKGGEREDEKRGEEKN